MKKILHYGLSGNYGGIEKVIFDVFKEINKNHYNFDFLVYNNEIAYENKIKELGGKIHKIIYSKKNNKFKRRVEYYLKTINFFKKNAKNYDVLHCSVTNLGSILPILLAARYYKIPRIILHAHNSGFGDDIGNRIKFKHNLNKKIINFLVTDFISVSKKSESFMFEKRRRKKYEIIKNPIDVNKFIYNPDNEKTIRNRLNLKNNFVVGHVGTFSSYKNHKFLLEVFCEIQKMVPKSKLLLIGDGKLKEEIKRKAYSMKIRKNIVFIGIVKDTAPYMHAMDVFVFPSVSEGFGNVLIEAQLAQIHCYVSSFVPPEANITNLFHYCSLNNSPKQWAYKIVNSNNIKINETKKIIESGHSIKDVTRTYEKLYH